MRRPFAVLGALAMSAALAAPLGAQKMTPIHPGTAGSPHVRTDYTVDGAHISIEYGRPSLKKRTIGKDVDPYDGKEWRSGADEATTLKTDKPLKLGTLALPAGTYTLYTVAGPKAWQLVVSKKTGQWGIPYPGAADDFGRAPMKIAKPKAPVEVLTWSVDDTKAGGALRIEWGTTGASIPFKVG